MYMFIWIINQYVCRKNHFKIEVSTASTTPMAGGPIRMFIPFHQMTNFVPIPGPLIPQACQMPSHLSMPTGTTSICTTQSTS